MFRRISRKALIFGAVTSLVVVAAAIAYWTTSGSGTGSATAGTSTAVTVSQVGTISALVPGGAAQAVDFKINNPASTPQYITSVAVSMTGVTGPNIDGTHPCTTADFTLVQPTATYGDLTTGDHTYSPSGATLKLNNTASNQDGCKNATVALAFSAS
jgi:hypothetical protein